ncbi:septum formation initiator [Hypnocyclicus thermotrophus]|uniref:Septum formation initiator n=1 Tax=Hypnocyclicus thermotrophus TaxID=1627895 RepID=A0AA46DXU5_9FUSO|nr:septum formation initiator family protein [Hypnocyclicus thermotrophus]TDT69134.1 septum formation initiator [Hypnocyclicus thermotrophus]
MLVKTRIKLKIVLIILIIIVMIKWWLFPIINVLYDINKLNLKIKNNELKINTLEKTYSKLQLELKNIENLDIIEKKARNLLDMKKENEKIYRIIE